MAVLHVATPAVATELAVFPPKPFGYRIGDVLTLRADLSPSPGLSLVEDSLPRPGPLLPWLELRSIRVDKGLKASHTEIYLDYQVFYAAMTVKSLSVPAVQLALRGPAGNASVTLPSWSFTIAPLHELSVYPESGEPLRPDLWIEPQSSAPHLAMSLALAGMALLGLTYLAYLQGWFGIHRESGRHFRIARARLASAGRHPSNATDLKPAFQAVHAAINATAGEPLFADGLPVFLSRYPAYARLEAEFAAFFHASNSLFFGNGDAALAFGVDRLDEFCARCLDAARNPP